jgi:hypothetical protein
MVVVQWPLAQAICFGACYFHRKPQGVPEAVSAPPHPSTPRPNATATLPSARGASAENGGGKYDGQFSWPNSPQNIADLNKLVGYVQATVATKGKP